MDLAVVIAAHNEARWIGDQLDALRVEIWEGGDWEVIVVDNRSSDDTAAIVESRAANWPELRLMGAHEQGNKHYAINTVVDAICANRFAIVDADDVIAPGWVAAMGDGLRSAEMVTGPLELDRLNPRWLAESRGRSGSAAPVGIFDGVLPFARGGNFGFTRAAFNKIGKLPEENSPCEDLDVSAAARRAGIDIEGLPDAVVHYRYRGDVASLWKQGLAYGQGRCRVVRDLVDHDEPRPARFGGWRSWLWLVCKLPSLRHDEGRATWLWVASNRLGQLRGSVRYRAWYL